ncbi:MAG: hypothetical protein CMJ27_13365 [Phycisphaerae bacterium]|nr:hypothetical protein [Phycisphaerae bacterium]
MLQMAGRLRGPVRGRICLIHSGRCGSTVLARMLEEHPGLYWDGETLGRRLRWWLNEHPDAYLGPRSGACPFEEVKRRFWRSPGTRFGFEVMPRHLMAFGLTDIAACERLLAGVGAGQRITLLRRNQLRRLISTERGAIHGVMHERVRDGRAAGGKRPFEMPLDRLHSFAGKPMSIEEGLTEYASSDAMIPVLGGSDALHLVYEDDVLADPRIAYEKVVAFLGLESTHPEVPLRRTNPGRLEDVVSNAAAIRERLRNTCWAWMCHE